MSDWSNFDKWWDMNEGVSVWASERYSAQIAWKQATRMERERCAKIAEQYDSEHLASAGKSIANQIRREGA